MLHPSCVSSHNSIPFETREIDYYREKMTQPSKLEVSCVDILSFPFCAIRSRCLRIGREHL